MATKMGIWNNQLVINAVDDLACDIHAWAKRNGFYDSERNDGESIAMMHSELSEALEGLRHGNPADEHCPDFTSAEVELADAIIRILDTCAYRGWRIGAAICAKMEFNQNRPYRHGKKF